MNKKITSSEKKDLIKPDYIGTIKPGLIPVSMSIGADNIQFNFSFYDSGQQAFYNFICPDATAITSSNPNQTLDSAIIQGPDHIGNVPVSVSDAVLQTDPTIGSTWAIQTYPVFLTLGGYLTWKWNISFKEAILPFRLDGMWKKV
ncbi:hypothetical protein ACFU6E_13415 [Bacillus cereus]|uniref:hypothetical protein n=1 Tax=Bacillus cereus TaxID=1396 RepID=UPI00366DB43C